MSDPRFAWCGNDSLVVNTAYQPVKYEHDYFHKEYKNQYGRSYTDDRQAILERSRLRYELIQSFVSPQSHPQLLEIGSAAGYFLKTMQDAGFAVRGWEISETMCKYANARGLKTTRQDFLKGAKAHARKKSAQPFDIVALFYVLEHIAEQKAAWQHLSQLVRPGGVLLMALPSAAGPVFRFDRKGWYATHPVDHRVDYSPRALKKIGPRFGFTLREAWSEGKHPQRFPLSRFSFMKKLYQRALDRAPLSDTIFAVLERQS